MEAQSPIPTTQQQSTQSAHQQPYINLHYPYYYPSVLPGAAGFQYHTMFAVSVQWTFEYFVALIKKKEKES